MKKNVAFVCTIVAVWLLSAGCKKIIDEIIKNPGGIAGDCRVEKLYTDYKTEDGDGNLLLIKDTVTVYYDNKGNPLSIRHSLVDWYLPEESKGINSYFLYYPDGRLAVYLENACSTQVGTATMYNAVFWHIYTYEGTTVKESIFSYASGKLEIGAVPINTEQITFQSELDVYGRIIQSGSTFYEYDEKGNLAKITGSDGTVIGSPVVYDLTKYNIKQTHRTWMFSSRNFSVNAPLNAAPSYNNNKLPTALTIGDPVFGFASSIRYKCR